MIVKFIPKVNSFTENKINSAETTGMTKNMTTKTTESIPASKNATIPLDHNNDYNFDDSSVVDSDSDSDSDSNYNDIVPSSSHHNNINNSTTSGIMMMDKNLDAIMLKHSSANNDIKPNIGSIAVQNSSDITFGNKTFYQGPVTIKQFVYDKNNKWKENELQTSAPAPTAPPAPENDNLGFINSSTDKLSRIEMGKFQTSNLTPKIRSDECITIEIFLIGTFFSRLPFWFFAFLYAN